MSNRKLTMGIGIAALGLLLVGQPTQATTISLNGNPIVSDNYEGDTVGSPVVADTGAWDHGNGSFFWFPRTPAVVTDAGSPGPNNGLQYASLGGAAPGQHLAAALNTLALGDVVQFDSMVYVPAASSAMNYPWQFVIFHGNDIPLANRLLDFWRNSDGTWESNGIGTFAGPTSYAADTWQHWVLDYTVGAANATLTINGVSALVPASNTNLVAGSYGELAIINNGAGLAYLDDVVPEPASLALLGLGGLAMLRRRHA